MSDSSSPTVAEILAGLGLTGLPGQIVIPPVGAVSTTVGVSAAIQNLLVIDTGSVADTTGTVTVTTENHPLVVAGGVQGSLVSSDGGLDLSFSGTIDQLNADLGLLSYASGAAGNDSISVTFTDNSDNSKSITIPVSVLPSSKISGTPTTGIYVVATSNGQNATLSGGNQIYVADSGADIVTASYTTTSVTGSSGGGTLTLLQNGGTYSYTNQAGSAVIVANAAPGTIHGGLAGSRLVAFLQSQPTVYTGGQGDDELIGGSGGMTVNGGSGGTLTVFGGSGSLDFVGGHNDAETVVGGAGAETIHAAATGGDYFGGLGGSRLFATGARTFLIGNVGGDVLTASAFGGDGLVAGSGNETLNGGGSTWENVYFGGSGQDMVVLGHGADTFVGGSGADTVQVGSGAAAIFAGSGAMLLEFNAGQTTGSNGPGRLGGGLTVAAYSSGGGATALTLSDGSQIHLAGVSKASEASLLG